MAQTMMSLKAQRSPSIQRRLLGRPSSRDENKNCRPSSAFSGGGGGGGGGSAGRRSGARRATAIGGEIAAYNGYKRRLDSATSSGSESHQRARAARRSQSVYTGIKLDGASNRRTNGRVTSLLTSEREGDSPRTTVVVDKVCWYHISVFVFGDLKLGIVF